MVGNHRLEKVLQQRHSEISAKAVLCCDREAKEN